MAKRIFDFTLALMGITLLWPILIPVWLAIKVEDGGPIFFRQTRVGRGGQPFSILKFRSMRPDAPRKGPSVTARGDSRVTRVGHWLRTTKFDELPQLWNVVRGDMSFVGPRPEVPSYVALYSSAHRAVLAMRPGITDEASIEFRDEEKLLAAASNPQQFYIEYCMPRKIAVNLAYAERATLLSDVGIIFRTICAVWLRR
ncbi:MAG: sugar transferase [Opitutaceae bacterium]